MICSQIGAARERVDEIVAVVNAIADSVTQVVVAVDAPLIVEDYRQAEKEVNTAFGRFSAGAYHTKMVRDPLRDIDAGTRLGEALQRNAFTLEPSAVREGNARTAVEVYPHPIHVVLFNRNERIPYKKGRKYCKRLGLEIYQQCMRRYLKDAAPSLLDNPAIDRALDPATLRDLPAQSTRDGVRSLKHYEDLLDGLTCAIAAWQYRTDSNNWKTYGKPESGYIVAPKAPDRAVNSHGSG